ncbi:hypothetical protein Aca07nite_39010 [Actinoplanes capillaceus]|uniref:Uncharacterized protein n=1 Tax=Actinoplanes campanulatus TaxID=113559 RepID=A0ABQ3WK54_9ACTN|nr:hypothetical protein Aca07nite_39010 [Actinoplanes capillaceus]
MHRHFRLKWPGFLSEKSGAQKQKSARAKDCPTDDGGDESPKDRHLPFTSKVRAERHCHQQTRSQSKARDLEDLADVRRLRRTPEIAFAALLATVDVLVAGRAIGGV